MTVMKPYFSLEGNVAMVLVCSSESLIIALIQEHCFLWLACNGLH